MMIVRLVMDLGYVEEVVDYATTRLNLRLTLSHIKQTMAKAVRVYVIHENGWSCDILKEVRK